MVRFMILFRGLRSLVRPVVGLTIRSLIGGYTLAMAALGRLWYRELGTGVRVLGAWQFPALRVCGPVVGAAELCRLLRPTWRCSALRRCRSLAGLEIILTKSLMVGKLSRCGARRLLIVGIFLDLML